MSSGSGKLQLLADAAACAANSLTRFEVSPYFKASGVQSRLALTRLCAFLLATQPKLLQRVDAILELISPVDAGGADDTRLLLRPALTGTGTLRPACARIQRVPRPGAGRYRWIGTNMDRSAVRTRTAQPRPAGTTGRRCDGPAISTKSHEAKLMVLAPGPLVSPSRRCPMNFIPKPSCGSGAVGWGFSSIRVESSGQITSKVVKFPNSESGATRVSQALKEAIVDHFTAVS